MTIEFLGIIILSLVLAVVLAAYERLQRKYSGMKLKQEEIETRAQEKTVKMMEEARDKALQILSEAKLETAENEGEFKNRLESVEEKQLDVYKEILQNVSNKIETDAMVEIADFKKVVEQETIDTQHTVEKKIEEEYQSVEAKLEDRASKMRKIDKNAEEVVKSFLEIVGRKSFSLDEQRGLIKQALEEAKKANVF